MPTPRNVLKTDLTRVWLMEGGAGPAVVPEYMGVWKAGAISWDFGAAEAIEIPTDNKYGDFQEVATIQGAKGKPSLPLTARYSRDQISAMLRMARLGCDNDLQVHIGLCEDPQNFAQGWTKIVALEKFHISNYGTDDLGALQSDERAAVNETIETEAVDLYEIMPLTFAEICGTAVVQEVVGVTFCDQASCGGECGDASNGCQKLFALILSAGGSPGLGAQIVYSADGGSICAATPITTLAANEDGDDVACFGSYLIVVSQDSLSHHYANKEDILDGVETWAEITTNYASGGPRAIWVLKQGYAWIGGAGGYVYFLTGADQDPTVQDAGVATAQDLNDVHAFDEENVMMVGASNAVIHTTDGATWTVVTGPAPGVDLNACWMKSETEWWVGGVNGRLYYTRDSGTTWTEKAFPGSGAGSVRDIVFVNKQVGYLAHSTATPAGRMLRTIDGGRSWYVLPEKTGSITANDRINSIATCGDPNVAVGGGLADNATDGILVKAS